MKKLALRLDDLRIDSFSTAASAAELRGTVRGHDDTHDDTCAVPTTTLPTAQYPECDVRPTTTLPTAQYPECG